MSYDALKKCNQFILHKNKRPVDYRTLQIFKKDSNWLQDPSAWTSFNNASILAVTSGVEYGVGFILTDKDPFFTIDIDDCLEFNGQWSQLANTILNMFPGALVETSINGQGLHIFGVGIVSDHSCKNTSLGLELYHKDRYIALGDMETAIGDASIDFTTVLPSFINTYFTPTIPTRNEKWTIEPLPEYTPFKNNDDLIKKALSTKSTAAKFGKPKAAFRDLWFNDNIDILIDSYPPISSKHPYDQSSADEALAHHLAFWTGCNCEHMLNLMWCSALVRNKWTLHKSYLNRTITKAVSLQKIIYTGGQPKRIAAQPQPALGDIDDIKIVEGYQFLPAPQQIEHFKGCVYVQNIHKIFIPTGALLKTEQFNATYGGYVFQLDNESSGKTTKKAFEAFTESQIIRYPKAEVTCFRPEHKTGELIREEDRTLINTYVPINTCRIDGDIAPFFNYLKKLLPEEHDRNIIIAYMAACIQHKGFKFQWCPLIQGVQGNGKTLLTRAVAFSVGERYTHWPFASEITEKFNDWLFDKVLIGVEDIVVSDHKQEVFEILKPMITNDRLAKRAMQEGQVMHKVCANFMLNMNPKNGFKTTSNDRRYAVFYTAQQSKDDLIRDEMDGDYFPKLYNWLRKKGYAIINNYLTNYKIPAELNPALDSAGGLANWAPETSSTNEAHTMALGGVEQEILANIEEGRQGFSNGWVSSMALERLLQNLHVARRIPRNRRREMMQKLGYDWHPGLINGRVHVKIPLDGGKPRLYIKIGHIHCNLKTIAEIIEAYQKAQQDSIPIIGTNNAYNGFSQ